MLLIDDLLLAPFKGLQWVFETIHEAAQEELAGEADAITEQLRQLYIMVETGQIAEAEFDTRERDLLDRFDRARQWQSDPEESDPDESNPEKEEATAAEDMEEPRGSGGPDDDTNDDGADE